jgi:antitoxin CcdA
MKRVAELIDALGGHRRLAEALRVPAGTVSAWKSRGVIPARAWTGVVAAARKEQVDGVTLETLAELHAAPRRARNGTGRDGAADAGPRKARVRVYLEKDLLAEAAQLGIQIDVIANDGLREGIKREQIKRWQAEHADVIAWYNDHIERDGIFGEEWRTF